MDQPMHTFLVAASTLSDVFTVVASGIAIYLFVTKRQVILSAFRVLLNYSSQLALSDLRVKLERLNDLTVREPSHVDEVVNTLNDILGQVRGNASLCRHFCELIPRLAALAENPGRHLTEPRKRALVSELRERLRHMSVEDYCHLIGESK